MSRNKNDIFKNNSYKTGDGIPEKDYQVNKNIKVTNAYSNAYLNDIYEYEDNLELKIILDEIFKKIKENEKISNIFFNSNKSGNKIKISKKDLNFIFNYLHDDLKTKTKTLIFYNPIYILEAVSAICSIEYKKLFDMLDTDLQEMLIIELNNKFNFLDNNLDKNIY